MVVVTIYLYVCVCVYGGKHIKGKEKNLNFIHKNMLTSFSLYMCVCKMRMKKYHHMANTHIMCCIMFVRKGHIYLPYS